MEAKRKSSRRSKAYIATIGYLLGSSNSLGTRYPVAKTIIDNNSGEYPIDEICVIARSIGLGVSKRRGMWYEHDVRLIDLLANPRLMQSLGSEHIST